MKRNIYLSTVKQDTPVMSKATNHREKTLLSVSAFAKKKNVTRQAVWHQIKKLKAIQPVLIGMDKDVYVDWNAYKDFQFNDIKNNY